MAKGNRPAILALVDKAFKGSAQTETKGGQSSEMNPPQQYDKDKTKRPPAGAGKGASGVYKGKGRKPAPVRPPRRP